MALSGTEVESIGINLGGPSGHCCRIVGIVGDAGSDLSSKVMESESSCVSPGSRWCGVEWGEAGHRGFKWRRGEGEDNFAERRQGKVMS